MLSSGDKTVCTNQQFVIGFVKKPKNARFLRRTKLAYGLSNFSLESLRSIIVPDRAVLRGLVQQRKELIVFMWPSLFDFIQKRIKVKFLLSTIHVCDAQRTSTDIFDQFHKK
jgi:hypothetical protein